MGFFNKLFRSEKRPDASDYLALYAYAQKQEAKGNVAEAMECYEIIQKTTPGFEDTYPHLFKYYEQTKQWEKLQKVAHLYDSDLHCYHRDDSTGRVYELKAINALEEIKRTKGNEKRVVKPQEPKTAPKPQLVVPAKKKEDDAHKYPTKANYKKALMENPGDKLEGLKSRLPEYDFYTGDNSSLILDDVREAIINLQYSFEDLLLKAQDYEKDKDFARAANVYEKMVGLKCHLREPYERLMAIYEKAGLNTDLQEFIEYAIRFFRDRHLNDKNYIRAIAQKYDCFDLAESMIEKRKVVAYFDGLFDIYNPFPWLYDWNKKRL